MPPVGLALDPEFRRTNLAFVDSGRALFNSKAIYGRVIIHRANAPHPDEPGSFDVFLETYDPQEAVEIAADLGGQVGVRVQHGQDRDSRRGDISSYSKAVSVVDWCNTYGQSTEPRLA